MPLRFFVVPVSNSSLFEQDLNGFLSQHKVVSVDRQLVDQGVNSFWAICVDYLHHGPGDTAPHANLSRSRIDYKAILPPEEFAVFSQLRELRKHVAQTEAVPVCALFTSLLRPSDAPSRARSTSRPHSTEIVRADLDSSLSLIGPPRFARPHSSAVLAPPSAPRALA